jgi:hypothetical protein
LRSTHAVSVKLTPVTVQSAVRRTALLQCLPGRFHPQY